jgi:hypothetical protein
MARIYRGKDCPVASCGAAKRLSATTAFFYFLLEPGTSTNTGTHAMQAIRLYAENEKWALMLLYAYIPTLIKPQFGYLEALAWIVGVWLLHWMARSVMRWLIFFGCGRHLTAEAIVNQWETDKMPFPAPTYQSAYDYLEDWLAYGQLGNQQRPVGTAF